MTKCWYDTNIIVDNAISANFNSDALISADFVRKNKFGHWVYHAKAVTDLFSEKWLAYMETINMPVAGAIVFYRSELNAYSPPHTDIFAPAISDFLVSVNWLISKPDPESKMIWYDEPTTPGKDYCSPAGAPYIGWPDNTQFNQVDECTIGEKPVLVQVDIPHAIYTAGEPRLLVTARIKPPGDLQKALGWTEILETYGDIIC